FWESVEKPSLIKFLEFRLREGNLGDSKTEHRRYSEEPDTITEYLSDSPPSSTTLSNAVWQWERTAFLLVSIMLVGEHYVSGLVTTTHKLPFLTCSTDNFVIVNVGTSNVINIIRMIKIPKSKRFLEIARSYSKRERLRQKDKLDDLKDQISVEQHLLGETNAGSKTGQIRNRVKHEPDSDDQEEKYQQSSQQKRKCTEPVVDAENNPFLGSKNNLDGGNESVLSLSDTEIVLNFPAIINDVIGLELGPLPQKSPDKGLFCGKPYTADIVYFQFFHLL
ncbi:26706_t:CDS:2, partial [Dentiscutata erythropus]